MTMVQRPDISRSLAQFDNLLDNSRVERIREKLLALYPDLGDKMQIATYVQPRQMLQAEEGGLTKPYPEQAVFLMVSPNPHKRHVGDIIKTNAFTPLKAWMEDERENRHRSDVDTALSFFKEIAKEHLAVLKNWREMN
jgi:hypothetical protein